ncbi:HAD-IA family hydrolase [bacterium AH-315-M10]|nr:HAD-IA family hydrolase [bacterium AH-315-M10]
MARPLKAIFFDIDDTLFSTSDFAAEARAAAVDAMRGVGLDYPREYLLRELAEVVAEFSSNYGHHFNKLLLRIPATAYGGVNVAIIVAAGVVAYHETKSRQLRPFPDVRALLASLALTDVVRGVITAGREIKQAEKLVRLDLYQYLTPYALFISDQIGISKPNVKLYQRACADLGLDPSETMHIGDNPLNDIVPPKSLGMITVLNRRGGKYSTVPTPVEPDYEISNFDQLGELLERDFGFPLSQAANLAQKPGADH